MVLVVACAKQHHQIQFTSANELYSKIKFNIYAPYVRDNLMNYSELEQMYGQPLATGIAQEGVFFKEYEGLYGRVRIYQEIISQGPNQGADIIIRFFPKALILSDLIELDLPLNEYPSQRIYLRTKDRTAWFTIMLDGINVTDTAEGKL